MKISVVIPVYNEEKYIEKCLKSVFSQTEKPDEVIVVDNNSTDKTPDILKKFPVKVINETTQGMIPARNAGFNAAKYEIIARTDADAILPKNWIKKIKNNFKKREIDALVGPIKVISRTNLTVIDVRLTRIYLRSLYSVLKHYPMIGSNMILTKKMWEKIKDSSCLDDKKVHEDIDLSIHINEAGGIIHYDPTLIVSTSSRRITHKPQSFVIEYPLRVMKTVLAH